MSNNKLIFPIGFDLETAVKDAVGKADMYLRQVQNAMNRKPVALKVEIEKPERFQLFSRQFSNSIDGISLKIQQAQKLWNAMTFDAKFDSDGSLSRRAQVVFDAFQQLTQASATMGQRLREVNQSLAQSEAETARLITAEYDKRKRQIDEQIRQKERQAAAEERVRQNQLKGVSVGYTDVQKQAESVHNLRLQYEALLPMLNGLAQKRVNIRIGIDKQFEAEISRINSDIARLRQSNLKLGAAGDSSAIQANLAAIRQLENELARINQQKLDIFNAEKIHGDFARLRTEIASVFNELQGAERKLASNNSLNAALDAQSQKVLKLHSDIQKLDQQIAQLNAQGKMYNADGSFSTQALTVLQQRISLTKQLEHESITGQQAQIELERQLRDEKRKTEQETKAAAKEAEKQAKAEAQAKKQAIEAANAENKQRQEAYNARVRQGRETQRILKAEETSIANITAKLQLQQQRLNSATFGSAKFNKIAEEVRRLTEKLEKANQKMRELTHSTTTGAEKQTAAVNRTSQAFQKQETYVSRLIKRLAVYAGYQQISNFLTQVREVTAQFELQRISLGAIIQDQHKANQLFAEIKNFALKSPVTIMDMTRYTKQLAAYRIEADKLFDTTKRLADVAVGLGGNGIMERLVLAYGETKASHALNAKELRQYAMMGIPMLELLSQKLSEIKGKTIDTHETFQMIKKRLVEFDVVKQVFEDLTNKGGMFYDMQEKQGNSLYGMWAKLGDAASVMYDQIGNTESISKGMRMGIQAITDMLKNWKATARMAGYIGIAIAALVVRKKILAAETIKAVAIENTYNARLIRTNMLINSNTRSLRMQGYVLGGWAQLMRTASYAVAGFGTSLKAIRSALMTTGIGALVVALGYLVDKLAFTQSAADKASEALEKVMLNTTTEQAQSTRNFEHLAKTAVNAADGSREQKEALEELRRTYKDMLPQEAMELEYLKQLRGNYDSLTQSIRKYVAQRQKESAIQEVGNAYGNEKLSYERHATDIFRKSGWSEQEIGRFWEKFYNAAKDPSKELTDVVKESLIFAGRDAEKDFQTIFKLLAEGPDLGGYGGRNGSINKWLKRNIGFAPNVDDVAILRDVILEEEQALEQVEERMKAASAASSEFAQAQAASAEKIKNATFRDNGNVVDRDSFLGQQMLKNLQVKELTKNLQAAFGKIGLAWDANFGNFIEHIDKSKPELISSLDFNAIIESITKALESQSLKDAQRKFLTNLLTFAQQSKTAYNDIVPSDPIVRTARTRFIQIAQAAGGFKAEFRQYLMESGEDLKTYNKRLKDNLEDLNDNVKSLMYTQAKILKAGVFAKALYGMSAEEVQTLIDAEKEKVAILEKMIAEQPNFDKKKGGGKHQDPRLQNLKEEISLTKKLYDEYQKLEKQIGATNAAKKIKDIYSNTIKTLQERAKKYGFTFELPFTDESLKTNMQHFIDKMKELQKLKGKKGKPLFPSIGKDIDEAVAQLEDIDFNSLQKAIEKQLKELADKISRAKVAKEFYNKILSQTGDIQLAANVTTAIYGEDGWELKKRLAEEVRSYLQNDKVNIKIPLDVIAPDNTINYRRLGELAERIKNEIGEKPYEALKKIAEDGQKDLAKSYEGYYKDLEKAKDYAQKRVDLARTTAEKIRQIEADVAAGNISEEQGLELKRGFERKEGKEAAKLEFEAFKETPLYIQMFEDLEHASTSTLTMMKDRLTALSRTWGVALDPKLLKEMQGRLNEIDEQLRTRNPFKNLRDSYNEYRDTLKSLSIEGAKEAMDNANNEFLEYSGLYGADSKQAITAERELKVKESLHKIALSLVDADGKRLKGQKAINEAQQKASDILQLKRGALEAAIKEEQDAIDAANKRGVDPAKDPDVKAANEKVRLAEEEVNVAQEVADTTDRSAKTVVKLKEGFVAASNEAFAWMNAASDLAKNVASIMEAFGADEEDVAFWNTVGDAMGEITAGLQDVVQSLMSGNITGVITGILGAIPKMIIGFTNLFSAGRIRSANKEIKRQEQLLEQLEYTYSRLEKSAEKLFGADYIANYNQRLRTLQARAEAYRKQMEAEQSKGKKADKDKAKEYENSWRDTLDEIADLHGSLMERMTGTSVESAARDFANAWIDAYLSFENTTEAIKDKFKDMIKQMVVESVMAKTVQMVLQPIFDKAEQMYKDGAEMTDVLLYMMTAADKAATDIDDGLSVVAQSLQSLGIDLGKLRDGSDEFTGIKREIASATSEEINATTAALNTQNYYVSHLPGIAANVAIIRQLVEASQSGSASSQSNRWTDWQQQAMDSYLAIQRNTADTVVECRRAANAAEKAVEQLSKVIKPKAAPATYGINVWTH